MRKHTSTATQPPFSHLIMMVLRIVDRAGPVAVDAGIHLQNGANKRTKLKEKKSLCIRQYKYSHPRSAKLLVAVAVARISMRFSGSWMGCAVHNFERLWREVHSRVRPTFNWRRCGVRYVSVGFFRAPFRLGNICLVFFLAYFAAATACFF